MVHRLRIDILLLPHVLHEVIPYVVVGDRHDTFLNLVLRQFRSLGQQLTPAVRPVGGHATGVQPVLFKRRSVSHTYYGHSLPIPFPHIHLVADAGSRVEVEYEVLETQTRRVGFHRAGLQEGAVLILHLVDPSGVTHLKVRLNLMSVELQCVKPVLEPVDVEQVTHLHLTCTDYSVEE